MSEIDESSIVGVLVSSIASWGREKIGIRAKSHPQEFVTEPNGGRRPI